MHPEELEFKIGRIVKVERRITKKLLDLLVIAMETKAYRPLGYSTMFAWLTQKFGYSNAAAMRRIDSARVLAAVPEVAEKIESGETNITNLSKASSIFRAQEKEHGPMPAEEKREALREIEGLNVEEAERVLLKRYPDVAPATHRDIHKVIDPETTRLAFNADEKFTADLNRAKEVLFHSFPDGRDADVLGYALKFMLDKKDPLRQKCA